MENRRLVFLVVFITVLDVSVSTEGFGCDDNFDLVEVKHHKTSCLHISKDKKNYDGAKKACKDLDAFLVNAEKEFRRENLKFFVNQLDDSGFIFIGGREDTKDIGIFKWEGFAEFKDKKFWDRNDRHAFPDYKPWWRSGEPDFTNGNEYCVCARKNEEWSDCKCDAARKYICEH